MIPFVWNVQKRETQKADSGLPGVGESGAGNDCLNRAFFAASETVQN